MAEVQAISQLVRLVVDEDRTVLFGIPHQFNFVTDANSPFT